jgi:hydrogenase-4 component B
MCSLIESLLVVFLSALLTSAGAAWLVAPKTRARRLPPLLLLISVLMGLAIAGKCFLSGSVIDVDLSRHLPFAFGFIVDRLSAFFLMLICGLAVPVALFSTSYSEHYGNAAWKWYWSLVPLFILSMALVVVASSVFAFMLGWELMTLLSAGLILIEGDSEERKRSVFIYLVMMHAGAAAVLATFLLFLPQAGALTFAAMRAAAPGFPASLRTVIFLLCFFGFGMKAGIVPLHFWLPKAHAIAPSPVSALMSAVMLKTAIYGFVRLTFDMLGDPQPWWGYLTLGVGVATAVLGILYALAENTLKRLLAYSSIENIGLIYIALGAALVFRARSMSALAALALVAALFHALNHALFKGLLFLGSGAIYRSTGTLNMEELGGLLSRLPGLGISFLIGCAAISGLPMMNGFVSEWLMFKSLLNGASLEPTPALPLLIGAVALASTLACACFVKVYGVTFLGRPRSPAADHASSVPENMNLSLFAIAVACLVLGIHPGLALRPLASLAARLVANPIPPPELAVISRTMPLVAAAVGLSLLLTLRLLKWSGRRVDTWACGLPGLTERMQYTATSFSKPLRSVFRTVYKPARKLDVEPAGEVYFPASISYQSVRTTSFEKTLYRPAVDAIVAVARQLRRLHTGNIQVYLLYIFLTIVSLLLVLRFT